MVIAGWIRSIIIVLIITSMINIQHCHHFTQTIMIRRPITMIRRPRHRHHWTQTSIISTHQCTQIASDTKRRVSDWINCAFWSYATCTYTHRYTANCMPAAPYTVTAGSNAQKLCVCVSLTSFIGVIVVPS